MNAPVHGLCFHSAPEERSREGKASADERSHGQMNVKDQP